MKRSFSLLCARVVVTLLVLSTLNSVSPPAYAQVNGETDWLTADFTLDNSKYAATRAQIDQLIRQGQKPAALETRYRLTASEQYDAQKIFRWAYAAYRNQRLNPEQNKLIGIEEALNRNTKPGAYDWIRLRFLVMSNQLFGRPVMELIDVGRRLLQHTKNDEDVTYFLVRNLQISESLEDRQQAIVLARANARKHPHDLYWQWTVADSVSFVYDFADKSTYKLNQECIAEYRKTLDMLPPGHPYRKKLIKELVILDLDFDKTGKRVHWNLKTYNQAMKNTTLR